MSEQLYSPLFRYRDVFILNKPQEIKGACPFLFMIISYLGLNSATICNAYSASSKPIFPSPFMSASLPALLCRDYPITQHSVRVVGDLTRQEISPCKKHQALLGAPDSFFFNGYTFSSLTINFHPIFHQRIKNFLVCCLRIPRQVICNDVCHKGSGNRGSRIGPGISLITHR